MGTRSASTERTTRCTGGSFHPLQGPREGGPGPRCGRNQARPHPALMCGEGRRLQGVGSVRSNGRTVERGQERWNGEWGTGKRMGTRERGNGGTGNGERGTGNGERGMGNGGTGESGERENGERETTGRTGERPDGPTVRRSVPRSPVPSTVLPFYRSPVPRGFRFSASLCHRDA